jgi:predicted acyl esterase
MPAIALRVKFASAVVIALGLASTGLGAAPALAVTPSPPPGAPAVESAPSSLVGLDPELPASVVSASAASGSHWTPENAIYGTASINDIAIKGAGGTTIRVNEIYPTTSSGAPAGGPFPVLLTMTPYGKGQGSSSRPGSAASPGGACPTGGADNYLAERGYIEVVEDVRGTGDSHGSWGLFDPVQQRDAIKVLNWAAHLPHSDGRVGTYGPSYPGIDQLLLAGAVGRHSPLKAVFPMVSANDIYREDERTGMARTPTPLHYYDLGGGQFDETSTYPFTGATPTRLYFGPGGTLTGPGGTHSGSGSPVSGVLGTISGSGSPLGGVLATLTGSAPSAVATGDTLVWSPSGAPCGRPIDQWSMGGISVPAGTAGLLAPCVANDQLAQAGPWAISYTSAPLAHAETIAGPVTATVYASSTTEQTELVAELADVTPSGASYSLTEGACSARCAP